jgi:predicted GTPase
MLVRPEGEEEDGGGAVAVEGRRMRRVRVAVLIVLVAAPVVFLSGMGMYALWERGWAFYAWWPMAASLALAYLLGLYWQRRHGLLRPVLFNPPQHWTDRDRGAWQLVQARARTANQLNPDKLSEVQFYVDTAQQMAVELARFYHPRARDPVASLTIPEALAVVELAAHDLAELVDQYLPGGHLLTINNWRQARQAADWYQTASKVYWLVSALFSPIDTGLRYAASQIGMSHPWQLLQQDLLVWFYTAFVHRVGNYLVELNSGRLRVGARRYRELMQAQTADGQPASAAGADAADKVGQVTITVMGQVKAGKSSLINAVLGEQRARTDVLPMTQEVTRYELKLEGIPTRLVLLDTVGYGHTGPKEDQLKATQQAAQQSDVLVLVEHARNPARQADAELLQALQRWFASRPDLKRPPILGVLTHIDLLSPAMEWAPPYDWQQPCRPKEQQMEQAVAVVKEQLGDHLVGVVPVCTAPGKVYGIEEWFLPALVTGLDEARAVALLRCLRAEADAGKVRKVFYQLLAAGKQVAKLVRESYRN